MKFSDVIVAVASLVVLTVLISFPLESVLVTALGFYLGVTTGAVISIFLSAIIVGCIFTAGISESRRNTIAKITVLSGVIMMFSVGLNTAVLGGEFTQYVREMYLEANPTAELSIFEWYVIGGIYLGFQIFINMLTVLALGFTGLYVGSILRKPKNS